MSDGIAAIQQRIAQIQSRFGTGAPMGAAQATAAGSSSAASSSTAASSTSGASTNTGASAGASSSTSTSAGPGASSSAPFSDVLAKAVATQSGTASTVPVVDASGESTTAGSALSAPAATAASPAASTAAQALQGATSGGGAATASLTRAPALTAPGASSPVAELLTRSTAGSAAPAVAALTPAVKRASGGYGRLQPPSELAKYGNGRIPAGRLASLGKAGHSLYAPAAQAFRRMAADAAAAGAPVGVTDSYRSYTEQVDVARRKGLYSQGGLAAQPGTSNHGWGLALDLDLNSKSEAWMRANAHRYGFVEDVPREPWHWTYRPTS